MRIGFLKMKKPGGFSVSGNEWPESEREVTGQMGPEGNVLFPSLPQGGTCFTRWCFLSRLSGHLQVY